MRKLLVVLVLLAVVVGVVDRVAVAGAEKEIARQVASRYKLSQQPEVDIRGIPFLTQALGGTYDEIAVKMGPMNRDGVKLARVDATLHGVRAPLSELLSSTGATKIVADRVEGSAVISRETIAARAPQGMEIGGNGDALTVSGKLNLLGREVPVKAELKVTTTEGGIQVTPTEVDAGGVPVPRAFYARMTYLVPVRNLPLGLKVTGARPTSEGLEVKAVGENVPLRG
ncbi:DUF2993 domain-containing protein [Bailinhaonella thermotolerans]|uniref:DUF2993 domain-containing protein n=1 Tax=Bailinhaonella thermotolerans TaxID=1070861 RepID=A0A3A4AMI7_9ACTN|nr:DUF2993 domain-containing protein [Bailinhaonella thermotolerans]RJL30886.1 DUF2993 domain-containing protein [Bailinhaonella thermotolerans]